MRGRSRRNTRRSFLIDLLPQRVMPSLWTASLDRQVDLTTRAPYRGVPKHRSVNFIFASSNQLQNDLAAPIGALGLTPLSLAACASYTCAGGLCHKSTCELTSARSDLPSDGQLETICPSQFRIPIAFAPGKNVIGNVTGLRSENERRASTDQPVHERALIA